MKTAEGFGLALAIDGESQVEHYRDGSAYIIGRPGKLYTLRLFMPKGNRYGVRLKVDGELVYGDPSDKPAAMDMKDPNNVHENELSGSFLDEYGGNFKFASGHSMQTAVEQAGIIQVTFFADASGVPYTGVRQTKPYSNTRGASRGGDLHTEIDYSSPQAEIITDYSLDVYVIGEEIGTITLHYASEQFLRDMGVIS